MTSDPAFTIPPLYCPDPVRDDDVLGYQVDDLLLSWIQQSGIFSGKLEVIAASHFGRYAMLAHPDTDDPDRLLLSAQCFAALFAVDDCYCDDERAGSSPALLGRRLSLALAAIEPTHLVGDYSLQLDNALAADPVLVGLRDYFNRVAHFATPTQLARVRHETIAMFVTMGAEAGWRLADVMPPVWERLVQRQFNSFLPGICLIDVISGYELPAAVYSAPRVRRATTLAASVTVCANDLYSASKEALTETADFDLPRLIAHEEGCTPPEAMQRAGAIHDALMREYDVAERDLLSNGVDPLLKRWLAGLRAWIGGSRAWHATSGRYVVPETARH